MRQNNEVTPIFKPVKAAAAQRHQRTMHPGAS